MEAEERGIHMGTTALTEAVFYILLSLDTPLHGYGIMQNVEHLSGGRVRLAAGTLYGALATLTERGWIVSLGARSSARMITGSSVTTLLLFSPFKFAITRSEISRISAARSFI